MYMVVRAESFQEVDHFEMDFNNAVEKNALMIMINI